VWEYFAHYQGLPTARFVVESRYFLYNFLINPIKGRVKFSMNGIVVKRYKQMSCTGGTPTQTFYSDDQCTMAAPSVVHNGGTGVSTRQRIFFGFLTPETLEPGKSNIFDKNRSNIDGFGVNKVSKRSIQAVAPC